MPKRVAAVFGMLLLAQAAGAVEIEQIKDVDIISGAIGNVDITVPSEIRLRSSGLIGSFMSKEYRISPGTHWSEVRRSTDGRRVAIINFTAFEKGREMPVDNVWGTRGPYFQCEHYSQHLMLDIDKGVILSRPRWQKTLCDGTLKQMDLYPVVDSDSPIEISLREWTPEEERLHAESVARESRAQARAEQAARRAAIERELDMLNARLPIKRQIGTRLCRKGRGGVVFEGFTERVSPDNGNIQIRVSTAHGMSGYTPQIIWDHPDNWYEC